MPVLKRPDGEICYDAFGQGVPILLRGREVIRNWRGTRRRNSPPLAASTSNQGWLGNPGHDVV